ncbi:hypothetical protein UFOVP53_158 [uncultured Caudovirales phage]|uniref:Uncharacterized protein n=1 Tax=uncultured Caudovirales phage TaxID=2100421 RepID=A0A6J5KSQ1_9CAUD|nr:hypothetical protein UFOVP53_158 [uncultured Caudovirales phage]
MKMSHRQKTIYAINGLYLTLSRLGIKTADFEDVNTYRTLLINLTEISYRYQNENVHKTP